MLGLLRQASVLAVAIACPYRGKRLPLSWQLSVAINSSATTAADNMAVVKAASRSATAAEKTAAALPMPTMAIVFTVPLVAKKLPPTVLPLSTKGTSYCYRE